MPNPDTKKVEIKEKSKEAISSLKETLYHPMF